MQSTENSEILEITKTVLNCMFYMARDPVELF